MMPNNNANNNTNIKNTVDPERYHGYNHNPWCQRCHGHNHNHNRQYRRQNDGNTDMMPGHSAYMMPGHSAYMMPGHSAYDARPQCLYDARPQCLRCQAPVPI
ncbi:hypothetical protein BDBG_17519 [Blastomyces gilchristii SLH14081]|nr:uncharacterized protein BDBG_17519 [Blastomyces gilchristii SLH14081]OAT11413.1 hypothetical protein BDBG_17519 [Blastomyces gilchristii SLH14081]